MPFFEVGVWHDLAIAKLPQCATTWACVSVAAFTGSNSDVCRGICSTTVECVDVVHWDRKQTDETTISLLELCTLHSDRAQYAAEWSRFQRLLCVDVLVECPLGLMEFNQAQLETN